MPNWRVAALLSHCGFGKRKRRFDDSILFDEVVVVVVCYSVGVLSRSLIRGRRRRLRLY